MFAHAFIAKTPEVVLYVQSLSYGWKPQEIQKVAFIRLNSKLSVHRHDDFFLCPIVLGIIFSGPLQTVLTTPARLHDDGRQ